VIGAQALGHKDRKARGRALRKCLGKAELSWRLLKNGVPELKRTRGKVHFSRTIVAVSRRPEKESKERVFGGELKKKFATNSELKKENNSESSYMT